MKIVFLLLLWFFVCMALWLFTTSLHVSDPLLKRHEFTVKSIFYWIVAVVSLIIGLLI